MYGQFLVDFLLISVVLYCLYKAFKLIAGPRAESLSTLNIKLTELKAQKEKLEEMEEMVETTKATLDIKRKLEKCDAQIKIYESQIKNKEEKGK